MEVFKQIELDQISEIKILQNVRVLYKTDLNPTYSKENLRVQFEVTGEVRGQINCYLCIDGQSLDHAERNYIFPLFAESMNILIGRQLSSDKKIKQSQIRISPPKISMNPQELNTSFKIMMQKYELTLDDRSLTILIEYNLEAIN